MSSDNRRSARVSAEVKVDYRTVGRFLTDYSRNLSAEGLFVETCLPLAEGERVRLRLTHPDGEAPFSLDGVVKWVSKRDDEVDHPSGMGIEFVDFDETTRRRVEEIIRRYAR